MSEEPIVRFENVSKRFAFTKEDPQSVLETVISFFSRSKQKSDRDLWALRNVSFEVMPGQGFGFVGRNGCGKSTLLKLITQILRPNEGRIVVHGRVGALLELGAGFHPDLTGRENIFLNAAVVGLSQAETKAKFDSIVAFSELGDYINMPVKYYSSGMYMRLGFSVAIHIEPDILIVDEILAVGDQAFQAKCIDAIIDLKRQGTTIIIVSHNINMIQTLCTHLVWLEKGEVVAAGPVEAVVPKYVEFSYAREGLQLKNVDFERVGDQTVELTAVRLLDSTEAEQNVFKTGDALTVEMEYFAHKPIPNPEFGLAIHRQDGVHVNGPNTQLAGLDVGMIEGAGVIRYEIETLPLLPARYKITAAIHDSRFPHCYDLHNEAYSFRLVPGGTNELWGLVEMQAFWKMQKN
ncbi:MAG: ABC transporter ATP-binding protein [Chloroflexi bacterium]|nr:MAG: ABC transporter ATP-binding protein [Chloroflexota bacterium]